MSPNHSIRKSALVLGAAVLAAGAVAIVLMTGGAGHSAAMERSLGPQRSTAAEPEGEDSEGAELVAVAVPSGAVRTVPSAPEASEPAVVAAADPAATCVVTGVLLMPRGFVASEPLSIGAWPLDDSLLSAPMVGAQGPDSTFRFEGVAAGSWSFVARAETDGRIAWGRSEPVTTVPDGQVSGVRIRLEEYVVEGIVTDRAGVPLAGIPVGYSWKRSDSFAGRPLAPPAEENFHDEEALSGVSEWLASSTMVYPTPEAAPEELEAAQRDLEAVMRALESAVAQEGGLAGMGYGSGSPPSPSRASGVQTSSDSGTSFILSGSTIELDRRGFTASDITFSISSDFSDFGDGSSSSESVLTDANGAFRIALEGPGEVGLTAPGSQEQGMRLWIPESLSVLVTAEAPSARADLKLLRAGHVEGRVIRSDSEPGSINVFLRSLGGGGTQTDNTDENGMFKFSELAPGRYLFYARSGGRQGQDFSLHLEVDISEGGTAMIDDVLTPSSSVFGAVRDSAGQSLAGHRVTASGAQNNNLTRSAKTDEDGNFEIVGMYACDYVLSINGRKLLDHHRVTVPPGGARVDSGILVAE